MATTHGGLKLGWEIPAKTESLVMKRKMEKIDSGESISGTDYELLGEGEGDDNMYLCF